MIITVVCGALTYLSISFKGQRQKDSSFHKDNKLALTSLEGSSDRFVVSLVHTHAEVLRQRLGVSVFKNVTKWSSQHFFNQHSTQEPLHALLFLAKIHAMLHLKAPATSKLDCKHGVCIPTLRPVRYRERIENCPRSVAPGRCVIPSLRVSDPSLLRWLLGF
jgi:hypothetical protein